MRSTSLSLGFVCVLCLGACGGGGPNGDDSGDDGVTPDGPPGTEDLQPPAQGFQLRSPDIVLAPQEEVTKCWYFQTPNTASVGVTRWESKMTPGSHHMIVYFSNGPQQPPGTIVNDCGIGSGGTGAVWSYSAQEPYADQQLPLDDGSGRPVGMDVDGGQYGFIQMHYLNASDGPLTVHVTLNVHTHASGTTYTPAAPFITFRGDISIPAMSSGMAHGTCNVPAAANFYQLGTHAHKQATHMEVRNGDHTTGAMVFETDSWSEPGGREWLSAPFHRFTSGQLHYHCDYYNPTNRTITTGDSAATDEMCMAVGYMFPASSPTICYNDFIVPF